VLWAARDDQLGATFRLFFFFFAFAVVGVFGAQQLCYFRGFLLPLSVV